MRFASCRRPVIVLMSLVVLGLVATGPTLAGSTGGILYETFGSGGVAAVDLANPTVGFGVIGVPATNIYLAGGNVYLQDGTTIYQTSPLLQGLTTVDANNTAAPTAFAVDPTRGILYEAFGSGGVAAVDLANPTVGFGVIGVPATNIYLAGGNVYLQDGTTIYQTSPLLQGLTTVDANNLTAPAAFAVMPAATVPEPSAMVLLIVGLLGPAGWQYRSRCRRG